MCYAIALFISSAKPIAKPSRRLSDILDFRGFLDKRYSVLALGGFISMLGQFVPYYYISEHMQRLNYHSAHAARYLLCRCKPHLCGERLSPPRHECCQHRRTYTVSSWYLVSHPLKTNTPLEVDSRPTKLALRIWYIQ